MTSDDFNDNSIDGAKWTNWGGAQVVETGGQLRITVPNAASNYYGVDGLSTNLTGSYQHIELASITDVTPNELEVEFQFVTPSGDRVWFQVGSSLTRAYKEVSGVVTSLTSSAYSSTNHRWLRIREASGTTYWETSTNGLSWSTFYSATNPITMTSGYAVIDAGCWDTSHGQVITYWDNFNVTPSTSRNLLLMGVG